jgi:glyoxylase-like metal-dependent hydrolase (beta-lactamase superfamily II)
MNLVNNLKSFETSLGAGITQIPLEVFPGFWSYAYLVEFEDFLVLIDAGSGLGESHDQLTSGLADSGRKSANNPWHDLTHIFITHGHIDHFGGLSTIQSLANAKIGIHELDRRNLSNYRGRRVHGLHKLSEYLIEAGVPQDYREDMLGFYRITKDLYQSIRVDFTYEDIGMRLGPFEFLHVPGHSAGHVVIRLHNVLFCGDHILSDITPHQAPEQLTPWTGLEHYICSLVKLDNWANGINLALCGHEQQIHDLSARIAEIQSGHQVRLEATKDFFELPNTVSALSDHMFGTPIGYDSLLAIEEAGAHVEYLYQRGHLWIENLDEMESSKTHIPLVYKRSHLHLDSNESSEE